jgi:hypothetical protein
MQYSHQYPAQSKQYVVSSVLFVLLTPALDFATSILAHPPQGNNAAQPFLIFDTPCTSLGQTQAALVALGVPHNELGQWQTLYLWTEIQKDLQSGWDPKEDIEKYLTPFFENRGGRQYRCIAPVREGEPGGVCGWQGAKKDRTISHICGHLGYNAYVCNGECDRPGW